MPSEQEIFGCVEHITFSQPQTGFVVAKLQERRKEGLTVIVGTMPGVAPGQQMHCRGHWQMHPAHGWQFTVTHFEAHRPSDPASIQRYIGSGVIKGIGPLLAERIVAMFGAETLEVIDEDPEKLVSVSGIGAKRVAMISRSWNDQKAIREVMLFLQPFGVTPNFAQKIFRHYREESIDKVKENPYRLAHEIHGIGFKSADRIAQAMGFVLEDPRRIAAGIEYVLHELSNEGNSCYPSHELLQKVAEILQVSQEGLEAQIALLIEEKRLVRLNLEGIPMIWLKVSHICELGVARELERLLEEKSPLRLIDAPKAIAWAEKTLKITLAEQQREAVAELLHNKLQIITGGPGTGKSTITKVILAICTHLTKKIILAAPTGRAAKRLSQVTRHEAKTIHSLLEWTLNGFKRGREYPLDVDLIIIDESSMIDQYLMYSLLRAIPSHARVLFIGDIHQLPSVGPGNVLKDLIESQKIPTVTLTEIFRQAKGSKIITNAHRIQQGLFPEITSEKSHDFFFVKANEPEELISKLLSLVTERLPKSYHLDPIDDIQVLVPMKRGPVGSERLNLLLQEALNPSTQFVEWGPRRFGIHDKVMQIKNNYDREVFNGDVGRVFQIDHEAQELTVSFDQHEVVYPFCDLDELVLAYAVSVHKYQGSECPCVIIPMHTSHFLLLHRNLLYTAVTRGKRLVILIGMGRAIAIAVQNDQARERYTGLKEALHARNFPVP